MTRSGRKDALGSSQAYVSESLTPQSPACRLFANGGWGVGKQGFGRGVPLDTNSSEIVADELRRARFALKSSQVVRQHRGGPIEPIVTNAESIAQSIGYKVDVVEMVQG